MSAIEREILTQPADWRRAASAGGGAGRPPAAARRARRRGRLRHVAAHGAGLRGRQGGDGRRRDRRLPGVRDARAGAATTGWSRSRGRGRPARSCGSCALDATALPSVVITAVAGSPCAERRDAAIVLDFADEESVVQTRFATTALALLLAGVGIAVEAEAEAAERVLAAAAARRLTGHERFAFLGAGLDGRPGQRGGAEAARGRRRVGRGLPGDGVPPRPDQRERRRARWSGRSAPSTPPCSTTPPAPARPSPTNGASPLASLVLAQRVAVALARARNLDPDHPHSLTRSVVLP